MSEKNAGNEVKTEKNEGVGNGVNSEIVDDSQSSEAITHESVAKLIQKALTEQAIIQKGKEQKKEKAKQSLAGLDEEAREKALQSQRIEDLQAELETHRLSSTKAEIAKVLSGRSLSVELVDFVVHTADIEECMGKIDTLEKIFKNMVRDEVGRRLKTSPPKSGEVTSGGGLTKDKFKAMSLSDKNKLFKTDKDLFMEMAKLN